MFSAVHQFVPMLIEGDAIGDHVLRLQALQHQAGRESEIFVDLVDPPTASLTHPLDGLERYLRHSEATTESTLLLYHVAQASRCASVLLQRPEPVALVFHNFTPARMIALWEPGVASNLMLASQQLDDLLESAILGIGDSQFNADDLTERGMTHTTVVGLPAPAPTPSSISESTTEHSRPTVLFVSRIAPNKGIHDLIAGAAVLKELIPDVEFRFVGGQTSHRYSEALNGFVESMDLGSTVTFTGYVSPEILESEYRRANVFCCLSDHEGFGLPLLEAMSRGLPVVAYDAAAVAETIGDAGLLLSDKAPHVVATALERVLDDPELRSLMRSRGYQHVTSRSEERVAEQFEAALDLAAELIEQRRS
jgi:glycosyltransferase involved in cell wall biosynthesis